MLEPNLEKYAGKGETQLKSAGIVFSVTLLQTGRRSCLKRSFFIMAFVFPFVYMLVTYTKIAVSLGKRTKDGTISGAVAKCRARSIRLMVVALLVIGVCWGVEFHCGFAESVWSS